MFPLPVFIVIFRFSAMLLLPLNCLDCNELQLCNEQCTCQLEMNSRRSLVRPRSAQVEKTQPHNPAQFKEKKKKDILTRHHINTFIFNFKQNPQIWFPVLALLLVLGSLLDTCFVTTYTKRNILKRDAPFEVRNAGVRRSSPAQNAPVWGDFPTSCARVRSRPPATFYTHNKDRAAR